MIEKIETMEALKLLAQEHNRYVAEIKRLEEISNIVICGISFEEIHIYKGLINSGLPLEEQKFESSDTRKYGILVDGVRFFELY